MKRWGLASLRLALWSAWLASAGLGGAAWSALGRRATSPRVLALAIAVRGLFVDRWFFVSQARHPRTLRCAVAS